MSTLNVSNLNASNLNNVSTIRDTGGTTRLTINTSDPVLTVGTGANIIKARNTAKWWIACSGFSAIQSSFGVASLTDSGSNVITINYSTATTGGYYAVATSHSHAAGESWNATMNNSSAPSSTSTNFRFSYQENNVVTGYNPFAWAAIGFGDQA